MSLLGVRFEGNSLNDEAGAILSDPHPAPDPMLDLESTAFRGNQRSLLPTNLGTAEPSNPADGRV
jgi:hypothetical protein